MSEQADLYIVEGQWEHMEGLADPPWLRIGWPWYRVEDAVKDRDTRIKNRPGCKFRVRRISPQTLRAFRRPEGAA